MGTACEHKKPRVKLSGTNGNVFAVAATVRRAAEDAGWTDEQWNKVWKEAKDTHSYDGVIQTFMRYFDVR